jgi:hypothetical protein
VKQILGVLWCGLLVLACRGEGPASASTEPGRSITVIAGDTGEPVAGANVRLNGGSYVSATSGRVVLEGAAPFAHRVSVDSPGFLVRETVSRGGGEAIALWPLRGSYSEVYVRTLLYKPSDSTRAEPSPLPDEPLMRIVAGRVSVVPSVEILEDEAALAAHHSAIAAINAATGGRVVFTLDAHPTASVVFRMIIDRESRDGAFTYRTLRDGAIVGGKVVFSQREGFHPARDVRYIAHELGHALGLQHSIVRTDMMYFTTHEASPETFTADEQLTIRLLLQRAPGNQYPDRDGRLG